MKYVVLTFVSLFTPALSFGTVPQTPVEFSNFFAVVLRILY